MITATTVAEVLAALAANPNAQIEINASVGIELEISVGSPILKLLGSTFLRLTTRLGCAARVVARESSRVVARESSSVEAWESSRVEAWESSSVVARGSSRVVARESSSVVAWGSSRVVARESSSVVARESSSVEAWESSSVVAWGSSRVVAWGSSSVVARAYTQIQIWSKLVKATATINVAVLLGSRDCKAEGGQQITVDISTAEKWCEYYGLPIKDGIVVLYKAVDDRFMSPKGADYSPGNAPIALDWDGPARECGGGLHFSPSPVMALRFNNGAPKFSGCPIRVDEIVVHPNGEYPDKVKAPRCGPCFEVDRHGEPVAGVMVPTSEMVFAALPQPVAAPKAKKAPARKRKAKSVAKRGGKRA